MDFLPRAAVSEIMVKSSLKILGLIGAAFASLISTSALAADWVYISTDVSGTEHFYDASSLRRSSNIVVVWNRQLLAKLKPNGEASKLTKVKYDCDNETYVLLSYATYNAKGETISSGSGKPYQLTAGNVVPDSIARTIFEKVCAAS